MKEESVRKALCVFLAAMMVGTMFGVCISMKAEALEFVDTTSINVPWTSDFTPLDSAWDSTGTQCIVVGNDTSGIQPSAWHYNEPSNTWSPIYEGTDPTVAPVNLVENDGTHVIYGSIQAAIDDATIGDTLNVWAGTYNENLVINKPLTIIGNGSANTIIDGGNTGIAVQITADSVTFNGFTVTGGPDNTGILLYEVEYCRIENNTVEGNGDGICITGSSNNIVKNNHVENNMGVGVRTESSPETKDLVGVTDCGGSYDAGVMFKMAPDGSNYTLMHDFIPGYTDGARPYYNNKLIKDISDANIMYGVTYQGGSLDHGTVFRINADGSNYMILHMFLGGTEDGSYPAGSLVQSGNMLFGMTSGGGVYEIGTIYRLNTDGSGFTILHSFEYSSGSNPQAGTLVLSTLPSTILYGMTYNGGTNGLGTIFRINTDGTGFSVMHNFTGGPTGSANPYGGLLLSGSMLYGMTSSGGSASWYGTIFSFNINTMTYTLLHSFTTLTSDGRTPYGDLLLDGTIIYGMTNSGGSTGYGTLFRMNTDGSSFVVVYNFTSTLPNGRNPYGSLIQDGTSLYGMTQYGGLNGYGCVFSFTKATKAFTLRHNFTFSPNPVDGTYPHGTLMLNGAILFGMTNTGGTDGMGTVFSIRTSGTMFSLLHSFDKVTTDCLNPRGHMVQDGSTLYGMSNYGGSFDYGTIYKINVDGTGFTLLRHFKGDAFDGGSPRGSLIQDGAMLYGMTRNGGTSGTGTIFSFDKNTLNFVLLHSFIGGNLDGQYPYGDLCQIGSVLYGMTRQGGSPSSFGTIFRINTDGSGFTLLHSFLGGAADGQYPYGSLTAVGSVLYGMTNSGGTSSVGTIFSINSDGTGFTILHSFANTVSDGRYPYDNGLTVDGITLYGVTESGGADGSGTVFKINADGSGYIVLHHFIYATEGGYPCGSLLLDGTMLYGMTDGGGVLGYGTIYRINKFTAALSIIREFEGYPNDGGYPYFNDFSFIVNPSMTSADNIIYHNNFIDNAQQAYSDSGNSWNAALPQGGNYWSDYTGTDIPPNGIGDTLYPIEPIPAGNADMLPWVRQDGWATPYTTFLNVIWDDVNEMFWICGEAYVGIPTTVLYIPISAPTTMVAVPMNDPITVSAMAADSFGGILVAGNDMEDMFYFNIATGDGNEVDEYGTGAMRGWNITSITYNPNDGRFYLIGNVKDQDRAVAFVTDMAPLTFSPAYCYIDTSDLMNAPGISTLHSISWNQDRNYALAVGEGVYRLNPWDGNPGHVLSWSTIKEPLAGTSYDDISWDPSGWNEAGIVGKSSSFAAYWRYYHTNPMLLDGYTDSVPGSEYKTCAIKPPSSPKWLFIPSSGGGVRINLEEKDESGKLSFSSEYPAIFAVDVWKQTDVTRPNLLNTQVDADSTYTFFVECNYTQGDAPRIDKWMDLSIYICAWYDGNNVGTSSTPGSWLSDNFRTRQFNITYEPATNFASIAYPTPAGPIPGVREFRVASYWSDPNPHGTDGMTHQLYINVTFGPQTWEAPGGATANAGSWNKNLALNDPGTWDLAVHMYDQFDSNSYNITYEEFGIKEFAAVSSTGSPTGSAPPGTMGYHLSTPCTIHYATNSQHYITVKIPDLHLGGNLLDPKLIPAANLQVQNLHSLAIPTTSDISSPTNFVAANTPLYIWGLSSGTLLNAPVHGTEMAGPGYTNYSAVATPPFEITTIDWWIDVPVSISQGTYIGTITITILD